ncbi:MAG: M48 family metalloprotease, partial [Candidatus Methylacidiphilales bacterium]
FAACSVVASIACEPLRRLPADAHWTQRARMVWPIRTLSLPLFVLATLMPATNFMATQPESFPYSKGLVIFFVVLSAGTGALFAIARMRMVISQQAHPAWHVLRDFVVYITCFFGLTLVSGTAVLMFSSTLSQGWGLLAAVVTAVLLGMTQFYTAGIPFLKMLGLVRPAPERIVALTDEAARRSGSISRPVVLIHWGIANALAFPGCQLIGITDRACKALDDQQIIAIMAHELAHLDESAGEKRRRLMMSIAISVFPVLLLASIIHDFLFGKIAIFAIFFFLLTTAQSFSRRMEEKADTVGRSAETEAGEYALALEQIHRVNLIPAVLSSTPQHTHPELYDRMQACGITPDYPRPAPPERFNFKAAAAAFAILVFGTVAGLLVPVILVDSMARSIPARHDEPTGMIRPKSQEAAGQFTPSLASTKSDSL